MKGWLREMKENSSPGEEPIIHVVGTKTDLVAEDPTKREVTFERTIAYIAEQAGGISHTPPLTLRPGNIQSPDSKRSSGFWNQDIGWDSCHEVNARDGEGIEEVFRVIARKLVEQRNKKDAEAAGQTPGPRAGSGDDYFNGGHSGSFRLGHGDKRRSWLGLPSVGLGISESESGGTKLGTGDSDEGKRRGRCC
jgi:GTPase SAR1 family protein